MNALRDRTLSCGLINGCRLYQISVCLEPESVPPGNHRVPDCYLVNVTPLEPGEEFPRVHGDDRFFYAKTFATCSSKRGSTVGGMAAHRRLHRRRVYRLVDDSDNVRSGRQRSITVGRRCNSNTPARNLWTSRGIGQGLRSWLETTGRMPLSRDFYRLAIPGYEELQLVRLWSVNSCASLRDPLRMRNDWH